MASLSLPVLVILAWAILGLLWWDHHRRVISAQQLPWTMAGMALVVLAMVIALVSVPASTLMQAVRIVILVEGVYGFIVLARKGRRKT